MMITVFSIVMSILWCDIFIVIIYFLLRRKNFIIYFNVYSISFLVLLGLSRLFLGVEFPFVTIVHSNTVFPIIVGFFEFPLFPLLSGNGFVCVADILFLLWIMGSIISLVWVFLQNHNMKKNLTKESYPAPERICAIMDSVTGKPSTDMHILLTPHTKTPMISGYFKPIIYLPEIELSDSELYYILSHEWNHYIHKDIWLKLIINITCSIFWWNPVVYLLKKDISFILEVKNDIYIASHLAEQERGAYLNALLTIATYVNKSRHTSHIPSGELGFLSAPKGLFLKNRFYYIQHSSPHKQKKSFIFLFYFFMILLFIFSYLFTIQPFHGLPEETKNGSVFEILPENSYLHANTDGSYDLYTNDQYITTVVDISQEPFNCLVIKRKDE